MPSTELRDRNNGQGDAESAKKVCAQVPWLEFVLGPVVSLRNMGSKLPRLRSGFRQRAHTSARRLNFDFVRLTPHFAQDDSGRDLAGLSISLALIRRSGRREMNSC